MTTLFCILKFVAVLFVATFFKSFKVRITTVKAA